MSLIGRGLFVLRILSWLSLDSLAFLNAQFLLNLQVYKSKVINSIPLFFIVV